MLIDHTQLEGIEWARLDWVIIMLMRNFENMHEQYQADVLSEERWQSTRNIIDYIFTTGGMFCWFRKADNPQLFTGRFREILEESYRNSPLQDQPMDCPELPALIGD